MRSSFLAAWVEGIRKSSPSADSEKQRVLLFSAGSQILVTETLYSQRPDSSKAPSMLRFLFVRISRLRNAKEIAISDKSEIRETMGQLKLKGGNANGGAFATESLCHARLTTQERLKRSMHSIESSTANKTDVNSSSVSNLSLSRQQHSPENIQNETVFHNFNLNFNDNFSKFCNNFFDTNSVYNFIQNKDGGTSDVARRESRPSYGGE